MLAILVIQASMLSSCYHNTGRSKTKTVATAQPDTAAFERTHHYSLNYNFVVKADSLVLLRQQPEELLNGMQTDSVSVYKHDHIVVADIRVMPSTTADSVWIQVARDQETFGWTREQMLLASNCTQRPNITVHINILRYPPSHPFLSSSAQYPWHILCAPYCAAMLE